MSVTLVIATFSNRINQCIASEQVRPGLVRPGLVVRWILVQTEAVFYEILIKY